MSTVINNINAVPGSIYKITLTNFLSFEYIELFSEPGLNLIIGPNGSGKSTFICAIILGLAGKIQSIGRSKVLSDYIRIGTWQSRIELELYRERGKNNVIVERHFNVNNTSTWYINRESVNEIEVLSIAKQYNIQVDNLCQLLPQDKVQDFTKIDTRQLLRSTLLVMEGNQLLDQLNDLIKYSKSTKEMFNKIKVGEVSMNENNKHLERLQIRLDAMVDRQKTEAEVEMCQKKKAWLKYEKTRVLVSTYTKELQAKLKVYTEGKNKISRIKEETDRPRTLMTTLEEQKLTEGREALNAKTELEKKYNEIRQLDCKIKDEETNLRQKIEINKNRDKELQNEQIVYNKLLLDKQNMIANVGDAETLKKRLEEIDGPIKRTTLALAQLNKKIFEYKAKMDSHIIPNMRSAENRIKNLEDIDNKRLYLLRKYNQDCYQALLWYRENKAKFKCPSYEPMLFEIKFREPKFAQYLESTVSNRDLIAFTFDSTADMNMFLENVRIKLKFKQVNAICSKDTKVPFNMPCPIEKIRKYGFYTYLSETFTAPQAIVNYLCKQYKIHLIPIGDDVTYKNVNQVPSTINLFFSDKHRFNVRVSLYSGQRSTSVSEIHPPFLLVNAIDQEEIRIQKKKLYELEVIASSHKKDIDHLQRKASTLQTDLQKLQETRNFIVDADHKVKAIDTQILLQKNKVTDIQNTRTLDVEDEMKILKEKQGDLVKEQFGYIKEMVTLLLTCNKSVVNSGLWAYKFEKVRSLILEKQEYFKNIEGEFASTKEKYKELEKKVVDMKLVAKQELAEAKRLCSNVTPNDDDFPYREAFEQLPDNLQGLDLLNDELEARLQCMAPGDDDVIREHRERELEMERQQRSNDQMVIEIQELKTQMEITKNTWLPQVQEIMHKINEKFTEMFAFVKCAGEVRLDIPDDEDDFEKYGILVMVSFRSNEQLQPLNAYTQSGGERALSTAIYLLALQRMTNVPFRCVDEINQGMDTENERKMFNLLTKVIAECENAQYFLLTPKLLTCMEYNYNATVHTVMNGKKIEKFTTHVREMCLGDMDDGKMRQLFTPNVTMIKTL